LVRDNVEQRAERVAPALPPCLNIAELANSANLVVFKRVKLVSASY
jgi:hypothetical protein